MPMSQSHRQRGPSLFLSGASLGLWILAGMAAADGTSHDGHETQAQSKQADAAAAPAVLVDAVKTEVVDHAGRFIGTIQAIQQVKVRARVEGFLEQVAFSQGSLVNTDQLLYQIEPAPFQAALDAANADLAATVADIARAQADLVDAQAEFDRYSTLVKKGDVSQAEFDRVKAKRDMAAADVQRAEASKQQSEAQVKTAQINLGYTTISSPIDGRIGATNFTVGNLVGPGSETLATVVQLDPIRAVFSIPSAAFVRISDQVQGDDISSYVPELILPTGEPYAKPGRVAFIDNQVNPATGSIAIYADFPNPEGILLPGQFITAVVHTAEQRRLPVVPASAVIQTRDGQQVYVVGSDHRVTLRNIKTGAQVGTGFAVTEGLREGEIVVVSGIQKIKSGMVVDPSPADTSKHASAPNPSPANPDTASAPAADPAAHPADPSDASDGAKHDATSKTGD